MKRLLQIGVVVIVALALVAAGVFILQRPRQNSNAAEEGAPTAVVEVGSIEEIVSATGNVVADRQASLAFATSGEIAEVLVKQGEKVEPGQVLARLDTSSLEWQIARSEASLASARARLTQAQKPASEEDLASAQAALDSALTSYDKAKEGPTAEDLASAQAALDSALASYDKAQEGPTAADLASAQAALDSAVANYKKVKAGPTKEDLAAAQAQVDNAKASVQQAQTAYDRIKDRPDAGLRQESLNLQSATISLEQAQANYASAANHPTASELAAAEAQVAQAEASLAALLDRPNKSEIAAAEAQVAQAEASLAALQDRPNESEIASAEAQVAQAEASLNSLLSRPNAEDVAVQEAAVEEATVALAQTESQLEDAEIRAPFGGIMVTVNINEGEWASPGAPALVLAATEPLILDVKVDEVDVAQLAEGQRAHLSFDALKGEKVAGTVTYIAPASTNVGGAVAYGVEISFVPETGEGQVLPIRLGMTADVDIVVAGAEEALLVPNRAIEADREASLYYVTRRGPLGTTERLEVQIGLRDESQTQVVEGLEEGDVLVLPVVPEQGEEQQGFGGPRGSGGPFGGGSDQ